MEGSPWDREEMERYGHRWALPDGPCGELQVCPGVCTLTGELVNPAPEPGPAPGWGGRGPSRAGGSAALSTGVAVGHSVQAGSEPGVRAVRGGGDSGRVPHSLVCLCSLPRARLRSEQRLEVQEQLLALRHWLDAVEKRLLALPEPGTALQVTSGPGVCLGRAEPGRTSPRLHRGW